MEDIVVAVVGGCGFLGQHIVKELQEWNNSGQKQKERTNSCCQDDENVEFIRVNLPTSDKDELLDSDVELLEDHCLENYKFNIKEIRVLDIKPFEPFLVFADNPPITVTYCDIRQENEISEHLSGVSVVMHCAAALFQSVGATANSEQESLFWETNLEGTENVIWACRKQNIRSLVYTSTVVAVMGGKKLVSHTETLTPVVDESKLLLGSYARSRKRAEDMVLNAHKTSTGNDGTLLTAVLRPVALYGEGDTRFIPTFIDMAKKSGGKLPPLGEPYAYHQLTYAGNAAVAHVYAMTHLLNGSAVHPLRDCGGLPTYVSDDSPFGTSDQVLNPFLNNFGLTTTTPTFPIFIVLIFTFILNIWASFWERIGYPSGWARALPSRRLQTLAGSTTIVSRTRAEITLGFKPKYTWEQAAETSLKFYEKFIEQKMNKSLEY